MGQQMVDKFMGFRVVNSGSTPPTGDKQHTSPVKKVPLRELSNETQNMITKAPTTSLLSKDKSLTLDSIETRSLIAVPPENPGKTLEGSLLPNETHNIAKSPATSPLSKDNLSSVHSIETRNLMTVLGGSQLLNETQNIAKSPATSPLSKDRPSTVHSAETTNLMTIPQGSPAETRNVTGKTLGGSLSLNETQNIAKSPATSPLSKDGPSTAHSLEIRNLTAIPWRSIVDSRNVVSKTLRGSQLLNETQNIRKSPATSPPSKDNTLTEHFAETRNLVALPRGSPVGMTLGGSLLLNETENIEKSLDTSLPSENCPSTVHSAEIRNLMDIPWRSTAETWNSKTMEGSLLLNETQNIAKLPATSLLSKDILSTVHSAETRNLMDIPRRSIVETWNSKAVEGSLLLNETQNIVKSPATSPLFKDIPSTVHSVETRNLMAIPCRSPVDTRDIVGKTLWGSPLLNETPNIAKSPPTSPLSKDYPSTVYSVETRNFMTIPQGSPVETWNNSSKTLGSSLLPKETQNITKSLLPNENQNIAKSPATPPLSKGSSSTIHSVQTRNLLSITQGSPNIPSKTPGGSLLLNGTQNIKAKSPATSLLYKDSLPTVHSVETGMAVPRGSPADTRNIVSKTLGGSPLSRDSVPAVTAALSGRKRKHTDSPSSLSAFQPPCNIGASGPLVYVRRKLDTEPCKFSISEDVRGASSRDPKTSVDDMTTEPNVQHELTQESKSIVPVLLTTPVASRPNADQGLPQSGLAGKAVTGLSATPPSSTVPSGIPASSSSSAVPGVIPAEIGAPSSGNLDWKERFNRLQMFLKSCDESSQENYITKLRSLSAAGRNQLAVDLEKRAIQLVVDEGIELHRMEVLNVLGKALPNESLLTHNPFPSQAQFERGDNPVSAPNESLLTYNPSPRAQFERGDNLASAAKHTLWRN